MCTFYKKSYPLILLLILVCSCSQDETSYLTELCVVKERGNKSLYLFTDDGNVLSPSTSLDFSKYSEGERYRVTYIKMKSNVSSSKESLIEIQYMLPVLIKDAIPRKDFSTKMKDPIWLTGQPWFGGGFLNFEFSFGFEKQEIKHGIFLVQDSSVYKKDVNKIYLSFGHDANKDASRIMATALASFPVNSISDIKNADSLIINVLEGSEHRIYKMAVNKD